MVSNILVFLKIFGLPMSISGTIIHLLSPEKKLSFDDIFSKIIFIIQIC